MRWSEKKESEWRWFGWGAVILISILVVMLNACQTVQHDPYYDGEPVNAQTQAIMDCAAQSDCFIIHIENNGWTGATFYLNGGRFAWLDGNDKLTLPIPRSRLDGGLCAQFMVRLLAGETGYTSKECLRPGGHFTLEIDNQGHLWLTPWNNKQ